MSVHSKRKLMHYELADMLRRPVEDTNTIKQAIPSTPKIHTTLGRRRKSSSAPPSSPIMPPSSGFFSPPDTPVSLDAKHMRDPLLFPSAKILSNFFFNLRPMTDQLPKARALEWLHNLDCEEWDKWVEYYEAHETPEERTERLAHDSIFNKTVASNKLEWARIQLEQVTNKTFPERTIPGKLTIKNIKDRKKSPFRRAFNLKSGKISPMLEKSRWSVFEPALITPDGIEESIKLRSFEETLLLRDPLFSKGMVKFGKESGLRSSWTYTSGEGHTYSDFEREVMSELKAEIEKENALEEGYEELI